MLLFDVLEISGFKVKPVDVKIHLATPNDSDNPFDLFVGGQFEEWQCRQKQQNFKRKYVVSLINMPGECRWMFAGIYTSEGCDLNNDDKYYYYKLTEIESCSELKGRLILKFSRPGRQSYLFAEKYVDNLLVAELFPERLSINAFPGYKLVNLTKQQLDVVVSQKHESWRVALSNISGVYLISDTLTGKLYVGSATGEGGIWQRWSQYSSTAHGGNTELKNIIDHDGVQRANHFRYSILEIADIHSGSNEILAREKHWKKVLLSFEHGFNAN